jgi:hypothetical protein
VERTCRIGCGVLHGEGAGDGLDRGACAAIRTTQHGCILGERDTGVGGLAAELARKTIAALVKVGGAGAIITRALSLSQGPEDLAAEADSRLDVQGDDMWKRYSFPVNRRGYGLWVNKTNEKKNKKA